ncbi:MAG: hypothetical protein Q9219_001955 [cf. Caloplaca sp. 3 TL-2023]
MDAFVGRKKQQSSQRNGLEVEKSTLLEIANVDSSESTDLKIATLASLFPNVDHAVLLDILVTSDGSHGGQQTSLASFKAVKSDLTAKSNISNKPLTRKGKTLHLFAPEDVEIHTPCSIIHNFLPVQLAEDLLKDLLNESTTFERQTFKMFDNVVQSPHTACFYVESLEERKRQQTEYLYNGSCLTDIREITPKMRQVSEPVRAAVNKEIARRIKQHYPDGQKLKYQSLDEWMPNAAFVNCYKGNESVGYHTDQLTYLGPRAVIGSLSLGVAREFRVRKIVARDCSDSKTGAFFQQDTERADAEGQISIHLPHNSLLVMHAEMQEEWSANL